MFEKIFKNIDSYIWKDSGCDSELDYAGQTSWMLFLKWFDDYEKDRQKINFLDDKNNQIILDEKFSWSKWAVVRDAKGKIDHNKNLTGSDLIDFVNLKLFPYLGKFKISHDTDTIEYKIGVIFSELKNEIEDGYILRDVLNEIDNLEFRSDEQKHELSILYESKIQNMGNAGRTGGQYYTPRPLIKEIVKLVNPKIGEIIYDGACGSGGFLVEAFEHIKNTKKLTTKQYDVLQKKTLFGKEKKNLAYIIGNMNMILHGIESPNITKTNTLTENIMDFEDKDKIDVVLANPPFGGGEKQQVQQNFPIRSAETAYLFLQHFIKKLKKGGRAGIIIKNTFLTNDDARNLRQELLQECNVHTILDLPAKVFTAGVKTVVLFFEKGKPTKNIWFYQINLDRNLGKKNPLNRKDLSEFVSLYNQKGLSKNSWNKQIEEIDPSTFDLTVTNPNIVVENDIRKPEDIIKDIENLDLKTQDTLKDIKKFINEN